MFCLQEVSNVYEADYMKEDIFRNADHLVKALCLTGAEGEKESNKKKKHSVVKENIEVVTFKYMCSSWVKLIIGLLVIIGL